MGFMESPFAMGGMFSKKKSKAQRHSSASTMGGLAGAGIGGALGGPAGAGIGMSLGSMVGGQMVGIPTDSDTPTGLQLGRETADYMNTVFPGTTVFERLGVNSPVGSVESAGVGAKASERNVDREVSSANRMQLAQLALEKYKVDTDAKLRDRQLKQEDWRNRKGNPWGIGSDNVEKNGMPSTIMGLLSLLGAGGLVGMAGKALGSSAGRAGGKFLGDKFKSKSQVNKVNSSYKSPYKGKPYGPGTYRGKQAPYVPKYKKSIKVENF